MEFGFWADRLTAIGVYLKSDNDLEKEKLKELAARVVERLKKSWCVKYVYPRGVMAFCCYNILVITELTREAAKTELRKILSEEFELKGG